MEKAFNRIVLSKTEPNTEDLWMRITIEKTPDGKSLHGHSLYWFSSQGWKKLFDFDTRYDVHTDYQYAASESTYDSTSEYNPEIGVVSVDNVYHLYDASRTLGANANLVIEKGLKYHVDDLQTQINNLKTRMAKAEQNIIDLRSDLSNEISNRASEDSNIRDYISSLESALAGSLQRIENRLTTLESRI